MGDAHRRRAAELARAISAHHRDHPGCHASSRRLVPGRGLVREACEAHRALFAALEREQEAGWPRP